jgi:hypothetical protein
VAGLLAFTPGGAAHRLHRHFGPPVATITTKGDRGSVVCKVAGEAHGGSVMLLPSVAWPGGLPCPWNRGTVDTVACPKATRGKRWS